MTHFVRVVAIVYMFVKPQYRVRSIGSLTLEVLPVVVINDKSAASNNFYPPATTHHPDMVVTASVASSTSRMTSVRKHQYVASIYLKLKAICYKIVRSIIKSFPLVFQRAPVLIFNPFTWPIITFTKRYVM
jgi:hypothetical protein